MGYNSINDLLERRCKRYRIEKAHVLEAYDTVRRIMDEAAPNVNLDAVIESREIMDVARKLECNTSILKLEGADVDYQNSSTWVNIYYKNKMLNMPEKEWLVFSAITYLILTENLYHQVVNILCYARVHSKVPPLHDEKLENHTELEGISKIELSKKQKFLHDECSELVDACNLNLRNSVAHMRFCLVPDLDPIHERHKTGTSYSSTTKVHTKKHDFYLFKKENGSVVYGNYVR